MRRLAAWAALAASLSTAAHGAIAPGTATPSSGNCGQPSTISVDGLKGHIEDVYTEVFQLAAAVENPGRSGKGSPPLDKPPLKFLGSDPKSIAMLRNTDNDPAKKGFEIAVFREICDASHSEGQTAFMLAHELAHHALGHLPALYKAADAAAANCGAWGNQNPCWKEKVAAAQKPMEDEADATAMRWITTVMPPRTEPRFPFDSGPKALLRLQDIDWAFGLPPSLDHSTLIDRSKTTGNLSKQVEQSLKRVSLP